MAYQTDPAGIFPFPDIGICIRYHRRCFLSYRIPFLGTVLSGIFGIITALVTLVILILALIGLLNVIRGEDANVPFCRGLADKVFGPENKF